jgi:uncharacterized integral membrane protein
MSTLWFGATSFAVVLVLLLIFILQNSRKVQISYLGAHGHLPLGVALLLAAVLGILLVVIPGTADHPAPDHRWPASRDRRRTR